MKNELKVSFENKVRAEIGKNYLSDDSFFQLFSTSKQNALQEVDIYSHLLNLKILGFKYLKLSFYL